MKDLTILCVSNREPTEPYYCYDEFFASCRKYGFEPVVVGDKPGEYGGLGSRPRLIKSAIERGLVPTEHLLFADCWDLVFAADPRGVLEWFLKRPEIKWHGVSPVIPQIIWNAEKNCFPDGSLAAKHPDTPSPYKYLNSGFGIGETEGFLDALEDMKADEIPDDHVGADGRKVEPCCQDYWMRSLLFGEVVPMALDTGAEACNALCGVASEELDFTGERILNKVTGSAPMAFHFNGGAKTGGLREQILKHLGL